MQAGTRVWGQDMRGGGVWEARVGLGHAWGRRVQAGTCVYGLGHTRVGPGQTNLGHVTGVAAFNTYVSL